MDVFLTVMAVIVGLILLLIPLFHFGRVTLRIVYRDTVRVTASVFGCGHAFPRRLCRS